jgi:hypothetical protein
MAARKKYTLPSRFQHILDGALRYTVRDGGNAQPPRAPRFMAGDIEPEQGAGPIGAAQQLAAQNGPLFQPDIYRRMVKPRHKRLVQYIRSRTSAKTSGILSSSTLFLASRSFFLNLLS